MAKTRCTLTFWAPLYVEAMYLMLQQNQADDYIIATGETCSLQDFVQYTFEALDLNWEENVIIDESLFRPTDLTFGRANPSKANNQLGWEARYKVKDVVKMMVEAKQ